jgi:conjugation system TraG family ATPase
MRKVKNLEDVLPVWKIERIDDIDCVLDKMGCVTVGFSVSLPEIFTLSSLLYESIHSSWVRAMRVLPVGVILHKQDWLTESKYKADFGRVEKEASFLNHSSDRHFNERPYLDHECYLYLTLLSNGKATANAMSSALASGLLMPGRSMDQKVVTEFLDRVGQFAKILGDTGLITLKQLSANELSSTEESAGLIEQYCYLQSREDPRVSCDVQIGEELKVGDKTVQMFTLADAELLPAACGPRITYDKYSTDVTKFSIGFAAPLGLLLPCNHIYNQYVLIEDVPEVLKKQEKRRLKFQSLSAYSRENAISRDAVNEYLNEAIGQGRMPVKAHFNLVCFSDNANELRGVKNKVSAAMSQLDAGTKQETDSAAQLFWAGIPGNAGGLPVEECFLTFAEQAVSFFNEETNYQSSISSYGLRLGDRISGLPLQVDLSDEPMAKGMITNRNKFVIGPSGSGKSVFCNHMIRSSVEQGAHAVIVDVGHSYKGLCELLGGYYFTYSEQKPISFNPFYFEGILDTEKKESLKALLLALWKKDDETFSRSEYVALSNALQGYYDSLQQSSQTFACFNSFYKYLQNDFTQAIEADKVQQKDFDLKNFLYVLRPYYKGGEFDYLLNATENLDLLDQRMIVFELDNIKDHPILFPVVTLIIMDVFIAKMRKLKGIRKIILIEEAWKQLTKLGMAEYIKYLFKTLRKFFGEAIIVTQDIDDLIGSSVVKDAIINNSDCKILLDQSKYLNRFSQIEQLLSLTEYDKSLILSLNKANDPDKKCKEVFIGLGSSNRKVYRVELSLEEYLAYTTEEKEKLQVQQYAQKYGSMQQGIKMLANHMREQQTH